MTEALQNGKLDLTYNTAEDAANSTPDEGGSNGNIVLKIPEGKEKALLVKLLKDPRTGKSYIPIRYWRHRIGSGNENIRNHPCRKSLGEKVSPELDRKDVLIKTLAAIKNEAIKSGDDDNAYRQNPAFVEAKNELEELKDKNGGYLLFVEPGSDQVKALKVGAMVLNRLNGREGWGNVKSVPSLLKEMQDKGKSPYLSSDQEMNKVGWVRLWKTGEKLATEYHMEVAQTSTIKEIEGEKAEMLIDEKHSVHKKIANSDLTLDDIPDPIKYERTFMWDLKESEEFVESKTLKVPERILNKSKKLEEARPEQDAGLSQSETLSKNTEATEAEKTAMPPSEMDVEGEIPGF